MNLQYRYCIRRYSATECVCVSVCLCVCVCFPDWKRVYHARQAGAAKALDLQEQHEFSSAVTKSVKAARQYMQTEEGAVELNERAAQLLLDVDYQAQVRICWSMMLVL